jgi:hypothetical protein
MEGMLHFAKTERRICAPKSEAIRESNRHLLLLRRVCNIVAIKFFWWVAGIVEIERWWKYILTALARGDPTDAKALTLCMAKIVKMASTLPDAPSKCPMAPLVLLILISDALLFPPSPRRRSLIARFSAASPSDVLVACALI